jgi:hypothetical protein
MMRIVIVVGVVVVINIKRKRTIKNANLKNVTNARSKINPKNVKSQKNANAKNMKLIKI